MGIRNGCRSACRAGVAAVIFALSSPVLAKAQTVVSTPSPIEGVYGLLSRALVPFTIGQTFIAPTGVTALTGFSLFLGYTPYTFPDDRDLTFRAYISRWDAGAPTGALWESASQLGETVADDAMDFPLVRRDFNVGTPFSLIAGEQYVVFLSTLVADPFDPLSGIPAAQNVGLALGNPYGGGEMVTSVAGSFSELAVSDAWLAAPDEDLSFELRFLDDRREDTPNTPVPEPSSSSLIALALLVGLVSRSRRSMRAES